MITYSGIVDWRKWQAWWIQSVYVDEAHQADTTLYAKNASEVAPAASGLCKTTPAKKAQASGG
jgi:hypothetical protein